MSPRSGALFSVTVNILFCLIPKIHWLMLQDVPILVHFIISFPSCLMLFLSLWVEQVTEIPTNIFCWSLLICHNQNVWSSIGNLPGLLPAHPTGPSAVLLVGCWEAQASKVSSLARLHQSQRALVSCLLRLPDAWESGSTGSQVFWESGSPSAQAPRQLTRQSFVLKLWEQNTLIF